MNLIGELKAILVEELTGVLETLRKARDAARDASGELASGKAEGAPLRLHECRWDLDHAQSTLDLLDRLRGRLLAGWSLEGEAVPKIDEMREVLVHLGEKAEAAENAARSKRSAEEATGACRALIETTANAMDRLQDLIAHLTVRRHRFG